MTSGNCRECGALIKCSEHKCEPLHLDSMMNIVMVGREAMRKHIAGMDNETLTKLSGYLGRFGSNQPIEVNQMIIMELTDRFKASIGMNGDNAD